MAFALKMIRDKKLTKQTNPNLDPNGSFFMPAQSSGISNPLGGYSRNKQCQTKLI